jgi:alanine racemase
MVKANAYGHGIVRAGQALSKADALGVACIEEGMMLREAGVTQPICLMEGLFHKNELALADQHRFTLIVHHLPHVEMLENADVKEPLSVWLKINTGMHRLGIPADQLSNIHQRLSLAAAVKKPIGLMTHFAEADMQESPATKKQIDLFKQLTANLPGPRSLANSAGILAWKEAQADWVRPGLMLYGASPLPSTTGLDFDLQPVMTLASQLIAITTVKKGEKVGYGGTWSAPEDMRVGVVGVGYGDGYPQQAQNGAPVLVDGVECSLVGRVSMDMLTVDLRKHPNAKIGSSVTLWGKGLPVERVAKHCHTSAYEILTRMTPRPKVILSQK